MKMFTCYQLFITTIEYELREHDTYHKYLTCATGNTWEMHAAHRRYHV